MQKDCTHTIYLCAKVKQTIDSMRKKALILSALLSFILSIHGQNVSSISYRGFVDAGYSISIGDYEFGRFEVNTSHGCQFNPYLFLGAGAGLHFMSSYETKGMDIPLDVRDSQVDIPVFANVRCNFSKKKVSPFIDVKGGTYVTNNGGLYVNASAGCRFAINYTQGVSIAVGYASEKLEFETFSRFTSHTSMDYTRSPRKLDTEAITMKVGFEF